MLIEGNIERNLEVSSKEGLLSMYDNPIGEVPQIPIGDFAHIDGHGFKKPKSEVTEVQEVALEVGAEVTERPNGEHDSTVIRHKVWIWVGGALGTAMGLTALGLGTAFAIEHHRRKTRKQANKL